MPKNAQNSWVGTQVQPQFPTYQTAGMLQPPTSPQAQPAPPAPSVPPVSVPMDFMPPPINLGGGNFAPMPDTSGTTDFPQQADSIGVEDPRARLVNAVMGATRGRNLAMKV